MTDVSAGFRPPCWCPCTWAPTWRLHTNLYKFRENVSSHIFHEKNCCDLDLGESLCICTFFLFPDSGLNLLNGFYFLYWSILNGVTLKTCNRQCSSYPVPLQNLHGNEDIEEHIFIWMISHENLFWQKAKAKGFENFLLQDKMKSSKGNMIPGCNSLPRKGSRATWLNISLVRWTASLNSTLSCSVER